MAVILHLSHEYAKKMSNALFIVEMHLATQS